jgi:hypothetical protein
VLPALGIAGAFVLAGCERLDEGEMRHALGAWFSLGETVEFVTRRGCAAGVFRLAGTEIGAAMPVLREPSRAASVIEARGRMALDDPALTPDEAMIDIANLHRSLGMRMRRAGLVGRDCMDDQTESAFHHALENPAAVLAYDAGLGALILMDPAHGLLVVTVGERP